MTSNDSDEYLVQTVRLLGLKPGAQEMARAAAMFGHLARAAAQVRSVSLPDETISAAVFDPTPRSEA